MAIADDLGRMAALLRDDAQTKQSIAKMLDNCAALIREKEAEAKARQWDLVPLDAVADALAPEGPTPLIDPPPSPPPMRMAREPDARPSPGRRTDAEHAQANIDADEAILALARDAGAAGIRAGEIGAATGVIYERTRERLAGMVADGRLFQNMPRGPHVRYWLPEHAPVDKPGGSGGNADEAPSDRILN
jgi:hypothetical protein